jgi:hypothetical protein
VISPNKMQLTQTNKLPLWPFWDKNHLAGFKNTFLVQNKNYSPFLSQKDKGKT